MGNETTLRFEDPRAALKRHGFRPKHSWGQNFLVSQKAVATIAKAAASPGETPKQVIEIGAGVGTLTAALLALGTNVLAIERDRDMCSALRADFGQRPGFQLLEADAAKVNYAELLENERGVIAGNLPYQLTGRLIRAVIDVSPLIIRAVVMVQEEVANRLAAKVGDSARGALSVIVQSRFRVGTLLRLKPTAFHPPPKVRSTVVTLTPHETPVFKDVKASKMFDDMVNAAFTNRRKTLRNSFKAARFGTVQEIEAALEAAGIDPNLRPERLEQEAFLRLLKIGFRRDSYSTARS